MTSLTSGKGNGRDKRLNPRYPKSRIWDDCERSQHRRERDQVIEEAGLEPDRIDPPRSQS